MCTIQGVAAESSVWLRQAHQCFRWQIEIDRHHRSLTQALLAALRHGTVRLLFQGQRRHAQLTKGQSHQESSPSDFIMRMRGFTCTRHSMAESAAQVRPFVSMQT